MIQTPVKAINKVVWAVDVFDKNGDSRKNAAHTLASLGRKSPLIVEPIYVLSPEQLDLSIDANPPWIKRYRPAAQSALKQMLKSLPVPGLKSPKVLVHQKASLSGTVQSLASYAKTAGVDLIAVGTHGRKGLSRFFLGSFTETLLLQTHIPVLVVGPHAQTPGDFDRILFATDFSEASEKAFTSVLNLARNLGCQVTLLHNITNPIESVVQSGVYLLGGVWAPVPVYLEKQEKHARRLASSWIKRAQEMKVKADLVLDLSKRETAQSIIDHAKGKNFSLIAMAAQSGPVSSGLIGSITRQVVRSASCPVWVLRP